MQSDSQKKDKPRFSLGLEKLREQLDWLLTRRVLAGVMVALFVGACLLDQWVGHSATGG